MKIIARLQSMAASEIMNIIPHDIYEEIKEKDKKPVFRAYVIGHEGEARATWVNVGQVVKNWFSSAIKKINDKLKYGTKIFHSHGQDNAHEGRMPIGEVVGKAIKAIKDKVSAIAIAYIYPQFIDLPLDVASIEADVRMSEGEDVQDIDIMDITGVALGNSVIDKPGFPGATLLSELQAFADKKNHDQFQAGGGGKNNMPTLNEIRDFVKSEGISPSDIFGREILVDDPVIKGYMGEKIKEAVSGEYAHRKRTDEKFDEEKKKWEEDKKKNEDEIKKLKTEGAKLKASDIFFAKVKERKLTDVQQKFIEKKKAAFSPQNPDELEKEVNQFLDSNLEELKGVLEITGQKVTPDKKGGGEPGEGGEDISFIP